MTWDDEDEGLWQELIASIKPLKTRNVPQERQTPRVTGFVRQTVIRESVTPPPPLNRKPSPISPRQVKKLTQQKIPIEARIDLHGMTVQRAQVAVMQFLGNALRNDIRCVEIVTGRGDPHRGTGQLKRLVPFWLEDPQVRPFILHIAQNPAARGGSLLVLLRRNRSHD